MQAQTQPLQQDYTADLLLFGSVKCVYFRLSGVSAGPHMNQAAILEIKPKTITNSLC